MPIFNFLSIKALYYSLIPNLCTQVGVRECPTPAASAVLTKILPAELSPCAKLNTLRTLHQTIIFKCVYQCNSQVT